MPRSSRPRIFIGLTEVAGTYTHLAKGFQELGYDCIHCDLYGESFQYRTHPFRKPWLVSLIENLGRVRREKNRPYLLRGLAVAFQAVFLLPLFVWCVWRFDVFIFGYGTSFLRLRELGLLRRLGKVLIFQFHGSDARPAFMDGAYMRVSSPPSLSSCLERVRKTKAMIERIERHADYIVTGIGYSHFFTRSVVDVLFVGKPFDSRMHESSEIRTAEEITVLHAPSDLDAKGTVQIRNAVESIIRQGIKVKYVEIHNRPNKEVLEALQSCDFVVDQLYSDIYMPSFSKEAAFFGKPAIVGGNFESLYASKNFDGKRPPVFPCRPDEIGNAIRYLAQNPVERRKLGAAAQYFVSSAWSPCQVAKRYVDMIHGELPADCFFDPHTLRYVSGVALSRERLRSIVLSLIEYAGVGALGLSDKPDLLTELMRECGIAHPNN